MPKQRHAVHSLTHADLTRIQEACANWSVENMTADSEGAMSRHWSCTRQSAVPDQLLNRERIKAKKIFLYTHNPGRTQKLLTSEIILFWHVAPCSLVDDIEI